MSNTQFSDLIGKTLISVKQESDSIEFTCSDGTIYRQYHEQDCCEGVSIEEIIGDDLQALVGSPVVVAEEVSSEGTAGKPDAESFTWTFYKLATANGRAVTIRWYGESNGYYSESVDFRQVKP